MRRFRFVSVKLAVALVVPTLLASCAARGPVEPIVAPAPPVEEAPAPEPPPPPEPDFAELYDRLPAHRDLYREGLELLVAGEEVLGEARIVSASNDLLADAGECASSAGCDMQAFLDTFDQLLSEQQIALKQQAVRVEELEKSAEADVEREPGTTPFDATIPELTRTASLLRGTDFREMISLNGPVRAALDDWLTWMRPVLMESYHNYQFLKPKIAPIYEDAGLPEALLFAMLATETHGKVHSYSRAGAVGPLQFIRSTGRKYGLTVVDGFDLRLDPEAATRANVAYLNDQFDHLNHSLELTLAAYNGGEGRMANLHRRYGSNLWDAKIYYSLPRETREYVPRILAAAWLFLHPEEHNLEFPELDNTTTRIELRADIALNELSVCLGQQGSHDGWFRTLRNLNPRLDPGERVEAGETIEIPASLVPAYEQNCLDGDYLTLARQLHESNYPAQPELIRYTVRRGDTLGRIASRFRCASMREIADINRVRPPRYTIHPGQTLKIPGCQ